MASKDLNIIVDAEDRATAKLQKVRESMVATANTVRETGEKTKRSAELAGAFAGVLGGTEFGSFAGEMAMMTERVGQFGEVAKTSRLAAVALKAALIGGIAVAAIKAGEMIGNLVFQTKRYREELDQLAQKERELAQAQMGRQSAKFSQGQEIIGLLQGKEREVEIANQLQRIENEMAGKRMQAQLAEQQFLELKEKKLGPIALASQEEIAAAKSRADQTKAELDQLKQQAQTLQDMTGEHAQQVALLQQRNADQAMVASLQQQLDSMKMTRFEMMRMQAGQNEQALAIIHEIELQEKLNEKKKVQEELEKKNKQEIQQRAQMLENTVDQLRLQAFEMLNGAEAAESMRLQMDGLDKATADRIASLRATIESIGNDGASLGGGPGQIGTTGNTSRLLSGANRAGSLQEKIAQQTTKTTELSKEQRDLLKQAVAELQALTAKDDTIGVVG